jgi:Four helix bundle sensory module for signal transduction
MAAEGFSFKRVWKFLFPIKGIASASASLLIVGIIASLSLYLLKRQTRALVHDTVPSLSNIELANANMGESFNLTLLATTANDPEERKRFEAEIAEYSRRTSEYLKTYEKTIHSDVERKVFDQMIAQRDQYQKQRQQGLELLHEKGSEEALMFCKTSVFPAYVQYKIEGEKLLQFNAKQGQLRGERMIKISTATQYVTAGIVICLFLIGFFIGFFK